MPDAAGGGGGGCEALYCCQGGGVGTAVGVLPDTPESVASVSVSAGVPESDPEEAAYCVQGGGATSDVAAGDGAAGAG